MCIARACVCVVNRAKTHLHGSLKHAHTKRSAHSSGVCVGCGLQAAATSVHRRAHPFVYIERTDRITVVSAHTYQLHIHIHTHVRERWTHTRARAAEHRAHIPEKVADTHTHT